MPVEIYESRQNHLICKHPGDSAREQRVRELEAEVEELCEKLWSSPVSKVPSSYRGSTGFAGFWHYISNLGEIRMGYRDRFR